MFLFLCVTSDERSDILQHGLRLTDSVRERLYATLDEAESKCRDQILVLHRDSLDHARSIAAGRSLRLPPDAFVNIEPYHAPRRVEAGGGYVVRSGEFEPDVLLIFRRGLWDLPKGKRDEGEDVEACATREVREELGISRVRVVAPLGNTLHGYLEKGRYRLKTTHWFLMQTPEIRFWPQRQEGIEHVAWVPYSEATRRIGFETLRTHMHSVRPVVFEHLNV